METEVPGHCGSPPVAKVMSINSAAVVWRLHNKEEGLGTYKERYKAKE